MASPALESMCCLFNDTVEHKGHYIWEGMRQGHGVYSYLCIISGKAMNMFILFLSNYVKSWHLFHCFLFLEQHRLAVEGLSTNCYRENL